MSNKISTSRKTVNVVTEFFNKTNRRCMVIWERTVPDAENALVEISVSEAAYDSEFFKLVSEVLKKLASEMDKNPDAKTYDINCDDTET